MIPSGNVQETAAKMPPNFRSYVWDGNMEKDVISRDMIIKALQRRVHCLRNSKEENKHGNTKLKNQRDRQRHWKKDQWPVRKRWSSSRPHIIQCNTLYPFPYLFIVCPPPLEYDILLLSPEPRRVSSAHIRTKWIKKATQAKERKYPKIWELSTWAITLKNQERRLKIGH